MEELENIEIEFAEEVTVNLGNFQNAKPGYRLKATVKNVESVDKARAFLKKKVEDWLEEDIDELRKGA